MSGENVIIPQQQPSLSPRSSPRPSPRPSAPPLQEFIYSKLPDHQGDTQWEAKVNTNNNSYDAQANFRFKKICDCQTELKNKISHYEKVFKKYKRARSVTHNSSTFVSMTLSTLSFGGLAISLSGVGAIVGIPISSVTAFIGLVAVGFGIVGKN